MKTSNLHLFQQSDNEHNYPLWFYDYFIHGSREEDEKRNPNDYFFFLDEVNSSFLNALNFDEIKEARGNTLSFQQWLEK